jgi:hypothetical protein
MALPSSISLPPLRKAQAIAAVVFMLDVVTPQGIAPYMFYTIAILIAARSRQQESVIMLGYLCTLLIATAAAFSPGSADFGTIVYNRIAAVALVWTTVALSLPSERRKDDCG